MHFNDFFITCTTREVRLIQSNSRDRIVILTQDCVGEFEEVQCETMIGSLTYTDDIHESYNFQ